MGLILWVSSYGSHLTATSHLMITLAPGAGTRSLSLKDWWKIVNHWALEGGDKRNTDCYDRLYIQAEYRMSGRSSGKGLMMNM